MRHTTKMRRTAERNERKATDPWFGRKRVTSFPDKKKVASKKGARGRVTQW